MADHRNRFAISARKLFRLLKGGDGSQIFLLSRVDFPQVQMRDPKVGSISSAFQALRLPLDRDVRNGGTKRGSHSQSVIEARIRRRDIPLESPHPYAPVLPVERGESSARHRCRGSAQWPAAIPFRPPASPIRTRTEPILTTCELRQECRQFRGLSVQRPSREGTLLSEAHRWLSAVCGTPPRYLRRRKRINWIDLNGLLEEFDALPNCGGRDLPEVVQAF